LAEYQALDAIEPWGETRADLRMGILASLMVNMRRRKGAAALKATDFMPYLDVDVRDAASRAQAKTRALSRKVKAMLSGRTFK